MKIKMLDYVVDIKVKRIDKRSFNNHDTIFFLHLLRILLNDANAINNINNDTYFERIGVNMSKAIYCELEKTGHYKEGRFIL